MAAGTPETPSAMSCLSDRAAGLWLSAIKEMAILSASRDDVASLAWGIPSFPTPEYIIQGVIERLRTDPDIGKYTLPDGLAELKGLVARKHRHDTGIAVDEDERILITAGNMQGMFILLQLVTNPGDEIIVTDPCFASHIQQITICGGKPVYWPLDESNAWSLDVDTLPALVSSKTKAIIINSPSNPTGRIFSRENLLRIGEMARTHDFMILLDDPYSHFIYEHRDKYFNLASVDELSDRLAYLYSFSKAYAMSGWRLSYMILPAQLKKQIMKIHDLNVICAARVSQAAGAAALSAESHHLHQFEAAFLQRRTLICQRLDALPHVFQYHRPQGAYYVFPRILAEHANSRDFCMELLDRAGVALAPGSAFGPSGEDHVRMAYCVPEDTINRAFDRMEAYFGRE